MDGINPGHLQALEQLIEQQTDARERPQRFELERELSRLEARLRVTTSTLTTYQANIADHRAAIKTREAAIRTMKNQRRILKQQESADRTRIDEISRELDPATFRSQIRRQVKAEFFSALRPSSIDPMAHGTTSENGRTTTRGQGEQAHLESIQEDPVGHDEMPEESRRRSTRNRTTGQGSNKGPRDVEGRKRSSPTDPENDQQSGSRPSQKKHKAAAKPVSMGPKDARAPVNFDEVYAGGKAIMKYNIVEYPKGSKEWYILRCLEHNQHFFRRALPAGAKHLSGRLHGQPRSYKLAFESFGVRVLNCTAEKAKRNNLAVKRAAEAGYQTPKLASGRHDKKTANITVRSTDSGSSSSQPSPLRVHSDIINVVNPVAGEIYGISRSGRLAVAVVLPLRDLSAVGMTGPSLISLGLELPGCYYIWKSGTLDWAYHYRDGRSHARARLYPVMVFRENMVVPPYPEPFYPPRELESYVFLKASKLGRIDLDNPQNRGVEGMAAAKSFRARMEEVKARTSQSDGAGGYHTIQDGHAAEERIIGETDQEDGEDDAEDDDDEDEDEDETETDREDDDNEDGKASYYDDSDDDSDHDGGDDEDGATQQDSEHTGSYTTVGSVDDQAGSEPAQAREYHQNSDQPRQSFPIPTHQNDQIDRFPMQAEGVKSEPATTCSIFTSWVIQQDQVNEEHGHEDMSEMDGLPRDQVDLTCSGTPFPYDYEDENYVAQELLPTKHHFETSSATQLQAGSSSQSQPIFATGTHKSPLDQTPGPARTSPEQVWRRSTWSLSNEYDDQTTDSSNSRNARSPLGPVQPISYVTARFIGSTH